eukprot:6490877-Amphidinium_carterae.1
MLQLGVCSRVHVVQSGIDILEVAFMSSRVGSRAPSKKSSTSHRGRRVVRMAVGKVPRREEPEAIAEKGKKKLL